MRAKRIVIVTVIALLTMAIAFGVSAQDYGGGTSTTTSGQTTTGQQGSFGQNGQGNIGFSNLAPSGQQAGLFPSGQGSSFFTGLNGAMPRNASLLGVAFLDGFSTYTFDMNSLFNTQISAQNQTNLNTQNQANANTQTQANINTTLNNQGQNNTQFVSLQQCGSVRVYKLSPDGVQDLWPNVSCDGSLLSVQAGGSGHYILYRFNNNPSAVNAPESLFPCTAQASANVNFGARAGTQAQSGNVVCVTAQGGTGTTAGLGTTQGQTPITANFAPIGNSGVTGSVNLTPSGDSTQINVSANGLQPGTSYVSLYYENSTCELESDSAEDVIGGPYTANSSGVGTTSGSVDHPIGELHSVSVRSTDLNTLYACSSF